jgi:DNA-binding phage protein
VARGAPPVAAGLMVKPGEVGPVSAGAARRLPQPSPAVVGTTEIAGWVAVRMVSARRAEAAMAALARAVVEPALGLAGVAEIAGLKRGKGLEKDLEKDFEKDGVPTASAWQAAAKPAVGSVGLTTVVVERGMAKLALRVGDT